VPLYLADTSAWNRSDRVFRRWAALIARDEIAITPPVTLELLYSARSESDARLLRDALSACPSLELDERAATKALDVQAELTRKSQHRGPKPIDLLIAAVAAVHDVVLLHYDRHFDAIARVTRQPMEWLARRGSLE
jgi:predicted nucleic acid-binding protein